MELRNGRMRPIDRAPFVDGVATPSGGGGGRLFGSVGGPVEQMLCLADRGSLRDAAALRFWGEASVLDDSAARLVTLSTGELQWHSQIAEKVLSRSRCLLVKEGRLAGATRQVQLQLEALLVEAAEAGDSAEALLAPAEGERPTLFVRARRSATDPKNVVLLLREVTGDIGRFPDLVRLYGLTQSEHQIVCMLMNGTAISDIASQYNISVLTVRTHLKRTYSKLGIRTKEQLFAKLIRLMAD